MFGRNSDPLRKFQNLTRGRRTLPRIIKHLASESGAISYTCAHAQLCNNQRQSKAHLTQELKRADGEDNNSQTICVHKLEFTKKRANEEQVGADVRGELR